VTRDHRPDSEDGAMRFTPGDHMSCKVQTDNDE
jgi:hypothetical protein